MLISSEQIADIVSGELAYASCNWCGQYSTVVQAGSVVICPYCGNSCDESGHGYGFGFETVGCRKYGLSYEFDAGDFQSGD